MQVPGLIACGPAFGPYPQPEDQGKYRECVAALSGIGRSVSIAVLCLMADKA